jgi:hypothetical protein
LRPQQDPRLVGVEEAGVWAMVHETRRQGYPLEWSYDVLRSLGPVHANQEVCRVRDSIKHKLRQQKQH